MASNEIDSSGPQLHCRKFPKCLKSAFNYLLYSVCLSAINLEMEKPGPSMVSHRA